MKKNQIANVRLISDNWYGYVEKWIYKTQATWI